MTYEELYSKIHKYLEDYDNELWQPGNMSRQTEITNMYTDDLVMFIDMTIEKERFK